MRFAGHPVVRELERLVGLAHSLLYQAGRSQSRNWLTFWKRTWPASVRAASRPILFATSLFWVGALIGYFLTVQNPILEGYFINAHMRQAINSGHLWTEGLTATAPESGAQIATHNITVSLTVWGLGILFGIGTVWLVFFNGLMLGSVIAACLRAGMVVPILEFVIGHGSLELPAIWISAGAGLLFAEALLFPTQYRRSDELRIKGRLSVQIIIGIFPMLLIAGAIESFISPSNLPGVAKAVLCLVLVAALVTYIIAAPRPEPAPAK